MCGIAGVLAAEGERAESLNADVRAMSATLAHRGPDDHDEWLDPEAGVALGHRRLAILDLSPAGAQPMHSPDGRWVVTFNGELYNHTELRRRLASQGAHFRGHSDTEVLVTAIAEWGLVATLTQANGMFALGAWDRRDRRLSLARDRIGEKPLYYGWQGRTFLFGSELKALRAHPGFRPDVDRGALGGYFRHGFVSAGRTIYRGISTLLPGTVVDVDPTLPGAVSGPTPYWSLDEVVRGSAPDRSGAVDPGAEDALHELLRDAVRLRLQADVPLGAFLSGGIDSSLIVALAQAELGRPLRTFTVAFPGTSYDESEAAAAVAAHLGTDHTEVPVRPEDALRFVPELPRTWDEPFADPSQLPTQLVCSIARQHVTVCLSGDGGDEIFGGYNRYVLGGTAMRWRRRLPAPARHVAARSMLAVPPAQLDRITATALRLIGRSNGVRHPGDKMHKLAAVLLSDGADGAYRALASVWDDPAGVVVGLEAGEPPDPMPWSPVTDPVERMMLADALVTLPDDMLVKTDRASMSVGLEVRVPLLDHRVVEYAWRLPLDDKIRGGQGKWILRRLLHRYVPPHLVERPKMGFDPPVATWLRGPLRDWAEALLDERRLRDEGYLRAEPVRRRWQEHQSGRRNHDYALWAVLMFQAWLETVEDPAPHG